MLFNRRIALCVFAVLIVLAAICLFVVGKSVFEFGSHKAQMYELLEKSEPENRSPPDLLGKFIRISHENGASLESVVARKILSRLELDSNSRMLGWHAKYFVWSILVKVYFSEDELYRFYCAFSFNGVDYGAERLARRVFNKSLKALSEDELAAVASILWSPSRYESSISEVNAKSIYLVSRYREGG